MPARNPVIISGKRDGKKLKATPNINYLFRESSSLSTYFYGIAIFTFLSELFFFQHGKFDLSLN